MEYFAQNNGGNWLPRSLVKRILKTGTCKKLGEEMSQTSKSYIESLESGVYAFY